MRRLWSLDLSCKEKKVITLKSKAWMFARLQKLKTMTWHESSQIRPGLSCQLQNLCWKLARWPLKAGTSSDVNARTLWSNWQVLNRFVYIIFVEFHKYIIYGQIMFLAASSKQCKNLASFLSFDIFRMRMKSLFASCFSRLIGGEEGLHQCHQVRMTGSPLGQAKQSTGAVSWCEILHGEALCDHQACDNVGNHTMEPCFLSIDSGHAEPRTNKTFWQAGCDYILSCWEILSVLKRCF